MDSSYIKKDRLLAYFVGTLGILVFIASIGALGAHVFSVREGHELKIEFLMGGIVQLVVSIFLVVGSLLIFRKMKAGYNMVSIIFWFVLSLVILDGVISSFESFSFFYLVGKLIFHVVPMCLIYLFMRNTLKDSI